MNSRSINPCFMYETIPQSIQSIATNKLFLKSIADQFTANSLINCRSIHCPIPFPIRHPIKLNSPKQLGPILDLRINTYSVAFLPQSSDVTSLHDSREFHPRTSKNIYEIYFFAVMRETTRAEDRLRPNFLPFFYLVLSDT